MSISERMVVARIDRLSLRELRLWVREGWVRPAQGATGPVFDDLDIARIRLLCDLRKELALSYDAIAVVLTLIDKMHGTRRDMRHLLTAVGQQPSSVRSQILAQYISLRDEGTG